MFKTARIGIITCGVLAFASVAYACCIFDSDSVAEEVVRFPDALYTIAGRIEREPPERLLSIHERGMRGELTGNEFLDRLRAAEALDLLNRQAEAMDVLHAVLPQLPPTQAAQARRQMMLAAMHLWWRGGDDTYSAEDALVLARDHHSHLPKNAIMDHIIAWAENAEPANPQRMLPDFFGLRTGGNKSAISNNTQLEQRGLKGADEFLLYLLRQHPAWENFDTFYSLAMVWVVDGKQPLAHYARARAWLEHNNGRHSRSPGADEISDIRPLTLVRTTRGASLVDVTPVTIQYRNLIEDYLTNMRRYAMAWQKEREQYAQQRIEQVSVHAPEFWAEFRPTQTSPGEPPVPPPPPQPAQAPEALAEGGTTTDAPRLSQPEVEDASGPSPLMLWGMLGGLVVLLGFGFALQRRAGTAPDADKQDTDEQPGQDA